MAGGGVGDECKYRRKSRQTDCNCIHPGANEKDIANVSVNIVSERSSFWMVKRTPFLAFDSPQCAEGRVPPKRRT